MIQNVITRIREDLSKAFADLFLCFEANDELLDYRPAKGGWTIREVLEHVSITNHFLLILIRKGTAKAVEIAKDKNYDDLLLNYDLDWDKLKMIGEHNSFKWNRPEHMEPKGTLSLNEIKSTLKEQMLECLSFLDQMPKGEGVLYKTMMSVNDLGKIDVYHYIHFLVQHVNRHLTQMEKVREEFKK
ncbi:DinB family protein [Lacibacter sp.]|uniref:DinB family protein n=1 Tax=Lacibacter sp. TaxID=1915409 RepID=UPI002B4B3448|nr:DinB family protein [Lacibacter sp.]HLP36138.1 DinB family protein [Lacibacter sp.]